MPDEPMFTTCEAAAKLGVSRQTLARWRRAGIGPRCMVIHPRLVLYTESDVQEWIKSHTVEAGSMVG